MSKDEWICKLLLQNRSIECFASSGKRERVKNIDSSTGNEINRTRLREKTVLFNESVTLNKHFVRLSKFSDV